MVRYVSCFLCPSICTVCLLSSFSVFPSYYLIICIGCTFHDVCYSIDVIILRFILADLVVLIADICSFLSFIFKGPCAYLPNNSLPNCDDISPLIASQRILFFATSQSFPITFTVLTPSPLYFLLIFITIPPYL